MFIFQESKSKLHNVYAKTAMKESHYFDLCSLSEEEEEEREKKKNNIMAACDFLACLHYPYI